MFIKRIKELDTKKKQRRLRAFTLQGAICREKYTNAIAIPGKEQCDSTKIISHFGCTNIIFAFWRIRSYWKVVEAYQSKYSCVWSVLKFNQNWNLYITFFHITLFIYKFIIYTGYPRKKTLRILEHTGWYYQKLFLYFKISCISTAILMGQ